jgi:hypothetical protein
MFLAALTSLSCRVRQDGQHHARIDARAILSLLGLPGLVSGIAGTTGEEVHERGVLVSERLLERHAGYLGQESQAGVAFQVGQIAVGLGVGGFDLLGVVAGVPPCQK